MRCVLGCMLLLALAGLEEACKCVPKSPQQKYCSNKLAIKGKVLNSNTSNGKVEYKVKVLGFKGKIKNLKVWTHEQSATCGFGQFIQQNQVYIFAMSKNSGKWWLNTCTSWVEKWSDLTATEILGVNGAWTC